MSNYIDNVVLKLKRAYGKDELVQALTKKLKEAEFENGILKSEKDELEYRLTEIQKMKPEEKRDLHQDLYVKRTKKEIKDLRKLCRKLKKENQELWGKIAQQNNPKQ